MNTQRISVHLPKMQTGLSQRLLEALKHWHERRLARRSLAQLDERMLHDIGLTEADVWRAMHSPNWS